MAVANNVKAILKDIKVTKKGIVLSFEDVRLQGEQLTDLASLIGGLVLIDVEAPQMTLFEDENVNEIEESQEEVAEESTDEATDENMDVSGEAVEEEEDYSQLSFEQMDDEDTVDLLAEGDETPQYMHIAEDDPITFTDDDVSRELEL